MKSQREKHNPIINDWQAYCITGSTLLQILAYFLFADENTFADYLKGSGTASPTFIILATFITQIGGIMMFFNEARRKQREKFRDEGKVERDKEWIEWAKNGKEPNKMPSKINPIEPNKKGKSIET